MSRERCLSLDRAKRQQQNVLRSGGYMPERSPHRTPPRPVSPQYSNSTPEILRDSFPGGLPAYSFDEFDIPSTPKRLPRPLELQYENALESTGRQRLYSPPRVPQAQNLPDEYLEDFVQPSFYEPPANSSFDELMCILATPPSRLQASVGRQLSPKAVENEVERQQKTDHKVKTAIASSPNLCPYKIPPLPDDPYDIPPHPKDPNDVVGFIRRSRAIHRLKALQEAEAATKLSKGGMRKSVRSAVTRKNPSLFVPKRPSGLGKLQTRKGVPQLQKPKDAVRKKNDGPSSPVHPPDYITPEYAAAILRARQLAGLKTRNPKLLPKSKKPPPPQLRAAASTLPKLRPTATYASIVERAAAIRAKAKAASAESFRQHDAVADECPIKTMEYDANIYRPQCMRFPHYRGTTTEELDRQADAECIAEAHGKHTGVLPQNVSLDAFEEFERQTALTPEEKEIYAKWGPIVCPPNTLESMDRKLKQVYLKAKYFDSGKAPLAATENDIAVEARLLGSAKAQTAAEARFKINGINDDEAKLLTSGERQLPADRMPSSVLKRNKEYCIAEAHGKHTGVLPQNVSLDAFEEFERQTALTPEEKEIYAKWGPIVCPPNTLESMDSKLKQVYLQAKYFDSGKASSTTENNIADQTRSLGSAQPQSAAEARCKTNGINDDEVKLLTSGERQLPADRMPSSVLKRNKEYCIAESHGKHTGVLPQNVSLDAFEEFERQTALTPEEKEIYAKWGPIVCPPNTLESMDSKLKQVYLQAKYFDSGKASSAATENNIADQTRSLGSAQPQSAAEARCKTNGINDDEVKLLTSGERQLPADRMPSSVLKRNKEYCIAEAHGKHTGVLPQNVSLDAFEEFERQTALTPEEKEIYAKWGPIVCPPNTLESMDSKLKQVYLQAKYFDSGKASSAATENNIADQTRSLGSAQPQSAAEARCKTNGINDDEVKLLTSGERQLPADRMPSSVLKRNKEYCIAESHGKHTGVLPQNVSLDAFEEFERQTALTPEEKEIYAKWGPIVCPPNTLESMYSKLKQVYLQAKYFDSGKASSAATENNIADQTRSLGSAQPQSAAEARCKTNGINDDEVKLLTSGERQLPADRMPSSVLKRNKEYCIAEAHGKHTGVLPQNVSLDAFEEFERQTALTPEEKEIYAKWGPIVCPPNTLESMDRKLKQVYLKAKYFDSGKAPLVATENDIADQTKSLGSAQPQSAAEARCKTNGINDDEVKLLTSGERQLPADRMPSSVLKRNKEYCITEAHGKHTGVLPQNVSLDAFEEFERQTALTPEEKEIYAEWGPKVCPPNTLESMDRKLKQVYLKAKYFDSGKAPLAATESDIAIEARLLGSAKVHTAAEARCKTNGINDVEAKLLTSGERQLPADLMPSSVLNNKKEYCISEGHGKNTGLLPQNVSLDEFEEFERQTALTPEEKEIYAEWGPIVCPPNTLESIDRKLKQVYLQANRLGCRESVSPRSVRQTAEVSPVFEMPPVIRFLDLMKRREAMAAEPSTEIDVEECMLPEYALDSKQFQDIADWNLANISGTLDICPSPFSKSPRSPTRAVAPRSSPKIICPSSFDDTLLEDIDIEDFGIEDIPLTGVLPKEDLDFDEDIDLRDITVPQHGFDDNVTLNELGIGDISSPELDDLSISMLEAYDADYPLDTSRNKDLETIQDQQTSPGFLTTVVSAVVDKFRNMFGGTPKDVEEDEDDPSRCINLDSTLPNMFATTPPPRLTPNAKDPTVLEESFTIPKYPKEYIAMVKKSQRIYKQEAKKAAEAAKASVARKILVGRGTISKRAQPSGGRGKPGSQQKQEPPAKIYPPGEYSPSYVAAVARARTLAGYKNRSAILNPERAAKIAAIKAAKDAELAAEEALPPVERIRKRIARLQQKGSRVWPRPSIETLGTLEAIRANLPRPSITLLPKHKWTPATRRRADKSIKEIERVFTKSPIRVFEQFKPMTPLSEESYNEEDLIKFTPLRAHEGRLRLKHLKDQASRKHSPTVQRACMPDIAPTKYSPIRLQSPTHPHSEELRKQTVISAQGEKRGEESIREELTKTSRIENGEVHTTTRKVTTKTDELGNVTCRIEEATGLNGEDDAITDNIDAIEAPELLNISDIEPPRDPSIPTPSQIIDRIRIQVQQKLKLVLPEVCPGTESSLRKIIEFPEDLPDEQLYDIDIPELETTPQQHFQQTRERSPDTSLPYFWDKEEQTTTSQPSVSCSPTPVTGARSVQKPDRASRPPKSKSIEGPVVIPPCPKDPKDYVGMVLYARAIHKRKQQQEAEAAARPVVVQKKPVRVPISRRMGKKVETKLLHKKKHTNIEPNLEENVVELPTEPPPLPTGYAEEVARARELAGLKNRTAALNPKVAAKKAAEGAALAEFEALPEYQKIMRRMEKVRRIPPQKRRIQPTADIIGTLEGIKASMSPINEVLRPEASPTRQTPTCGRQQITHKELQELKPARNLSLDEFESLEEQCDIAEAYEKQAAEHYALDEFEEYERQVAKEMAAEELEKQTAGIESHFEKQNPEDEILALEREIYVESKSTICTSNLSPNEFESQNKKLQSAAKRINPQPVAEDYCMTNRIKDLKAKLLGSGESHIGISEVLNKSKEYSIRKRNNELQLKVLDSTKTPQNLKKARPRNIVHEYLAQYDEGRVCPSSAQTMPPSNNQEFYQELIEDFCPTNKQFEIVGEVAFGDLSPSTPMDPKERLRRIKEYQRLSNPMRDTNAKEETFTSPSIDYSPIHLFTTTGESRSFTTRDISPLAPRSENILVDLEAPSLEYRVKQFKDLHDMPFDEIEFEDEPSFVTASFDKPLTPPPHPSELINRIRQQVQERLRNEKPLQDQNKSVSTFRFPQQFPKEDLFELSDPSLAHTTLGDTPTIKLSGRISPSTKTSPARVPSPVRKLTPTSTIQQDTDVGHAPAKPVEEMYQHKYPKGYVEMVMKARAIHKQKAEMAAAAPPSEPTKKKGRITTTIPGRKVIMKKGLVRPPKAIKKKANQTLVQLEDERKCPAEPPPLPPEYLADVALARQLAGYKNRTAALNPEVAARMAREKAAEEAETAAYANLPEHEKIKVRMERLRKKSGHRQRVQPNMEQLAFIQAMTEAYTQKTPSRDPSFSNVKSSYSQQRLSTTPCSKRNADIESAALAEFEALEKEVASPHICPRYQTDEKPPALDDGAFDLLGIKANAQRQTLATPPRLDAHERYRRLLSQIQTIHKTPAPPPTPIQTPDIHFSPIRFASSPTIPQRGQQAEKSTTQTTRSGDNTIKEQVVTTSEVVNGQLQQVTKFVTTTTDPSGNVSCQFNESRQLNTEDTLTVEDEIADIEQPSFLDVTPISPTDIPRPRDIIDRIQRDVKMKPRPDVPTGKLIDLRTPPRRLPLPQNMTEDELFEMSCPALPKTPTKSPVQSLRTSPSRYHRDVSIPELFVATPEPPTPPLPPVSPLRYRVHSPEGPIVIPSCPKDPTDYKGMVRMSRKIYELKLQKKAEAKAAAEAAAIEASKQSKKERVPISRWTAPPPKRATTRKKLVMKKRAPTEKKLQPDGEVRECPSEPPQLPEGYVDEVARARQLAGLKNVTSALNPKVAAREAVKAAAAAEEAKKALEREAAKEQASNAPPPPPADYETLMSRIVSMRKRGYMPKVQPSLQSAAYLNAVKGAMDTRQPTGVVEPAEARYKRILAARAFSPIPALEECGMETTQFPEDVQYTPVTLGSPAAEYVEGIGFDMRGLHDIGDLEDIQEPSFLDESRSQTADTDRYIPPSPKTPPPTPSAIIRRIREQVQTKLAAEKVACPISSETPTPLYFPEDLPEEVLFELSAPPFTRTPQSQSPTRMYTPNISIPRYFEVTPLSKLPTPMSLSNKRTETRSGTTVKKVPASASPPLMGVHPGLRVVTPEGPLVLPPHPNGPESVVDMIRRSQLIHKFKQKQEAAKANAKEITRTGVRVPISRRPSGPTTRATKKVLRPGKPKEKTKKKNEVQLPVDCAAEPPQLPPDYVAAVARARRLAGLKNTTDLLNPPQDYGTIMARVAALKAVRGEIEPTAQELAEAQNIVRRPERKEVEEKQQQTPRPAIERYRAFRSRVQSETPTTSKIPYSPIKTPVLDNLPPYNPVCLPPTPPFFQNINMSDLKDISMPYDMGETQNTDICDISMPFDMDDEETDARDICVPMNETAQYEDTNLDDISISFNMNESPYCRREYEYIERDSDSVMGLESLKSTERRCRTARRR